MSQQVVQTYIMELRQAIQNMRTLLDTEMRTRVFPDIHHAGDEIMDAADRISRQLQTLINGGLQDTNTQDEKTSEYVAEVNPDSNKDSQASYKGESNPRKGKTTKAVATDNTTGQSTNSAIDNTPVIDDSQYSAGSAFEAPRVVS